VTSRTTGNDTFNHEWLQIQLPQAITLSYFLLSTRIHGTYGNEKPKAGRLYASNDGITWDKITTFDNLTYTATGTNSRIQVKVDVKSTQAYKYYRLAVTEILHESGSASWVYIEELQLFESTLGVGTSATTAKLTVDGGLGLAKGSQVFAGSDVITEFPKHDRPLTKYPEVAMTAATTGGYTATASSRYDSSGNYNAEHVFDNEILSDLNWISSGSPNTYNETTGIATSQDSLNGENGSYVTLELPKAIKPVYMRLYHRPADSSAPRAPKSGYIYGSNDNSTWTQIGSFSYSSHTGGDSEYKHISLDSGDYKYRYLTFQVTSVFPSGSSFNAVSIRELEYYGTEEGDESVDIVHKSIPNKPSQQQLAVYYEARDPNSYSFADSTKVYDLSGNGRTGAVSGGVGYDAVDNALTFSGAYTSNVTTSDHGLGTGDVIYTTSFWFKRTAVASTYDYLVLMGNGGSQYQAIVMYISSDTLRLDHWSSQTTVREPIVLNKWYHVVAGHRGGSTPSLTNDFIYIDGLPANVSISGTAAALNLTGSKLTLGSSHYTTTEFFQGSIANFRLYSKVLNADQVRELYEYDAERFGHRQNVVALHKGNLGVGVPNPTSRFEVAGADGVQEYPPKAMTANETYIPGHGVFRASATVYNSSYQPYYVFDKSSIIWYSDPTYYDGSALYATTAPGNYLKNRRLASNTPKGEYIIIELPYEIKLKRYFIQRQSGGWWVPQAITYYAKKSIDATWTEIDSHGSILGTYKNGTYSTDGTDNPVYRELNINEAYKYFALVITAANGGGGTSLREWRLFGTPAPSSLEDGHLTLGKALTLPRVSGHPAGAETPRAESLVVHYDTTVDSVVAGSTVVDISGNGINGTLVGNATYSSTDRAVVFDGSGDYVSGTLNNPAGAWVHSVSCWWKTSIDPATYYDTIFSIGDFTATEFTTFYIMSDEILVSIYGSGALFPFSLQVNRWYHSTVVMRGTTSSISDIDFYLDGVKLTSSGQFGTATTRALPANASLRLGREVSGGSNYLTGSISNFKLWNVALTAEEVAAEYALGRTGKSINLTDTSLCLGGTVPRAQLDVRGGALFDGNLRMMGQLALTNAPKFFAYSSNKNSISYVASTPIILNNTTYNTLSCYSTSTGAFTAPFSGFYQFNYTVHNIDVNDASLCLLYKSVSTETSWTNAHGKTFGTGLTNEGDDFVLTSPSNVIVHFSHLLKLDTNNQVAIGFRHNTSGTISVYNGHTHFSGFLYSAV
jgi:hypothetical protein